MNWSFVPQKMSALTSSLRSKVIATDFSANNQADGGASLYVSAAAELARFSCMDDTPSAYSATHVGDVAQLFVHGMDLENKKTYRMAHLQFYSFKDDEAFISFHAYVSNII